MKLTVCGLPCKVISSAYDKVKCISPALFTKKSQEAFNLQKLEKLEPDDVFCDKAKPEVCKMAFEHDFRTYYSGSRNCFFGADFGKYKKADVKRMRIFPALGRNLAYLRNSILQGSNDNQTWVDLVNIGNDIIENWNEYSPKNDESWRYRYFRIKGNNYCQTSEIEFIGFIYSDVDNDDITSIQCKMGGSLNGVDFPVSTNSVEYRNDLTGLILVILPKHGSIKGGDQVIFTGINLDKDSTVTIDGIDCVVDKAASSTSQIVCVTGPRPKHTEPYLVIKSNTRGKVATNNKLFYYAERWTDSDTWGGELAPRKGDSVVIPKGMTLLMDTSTDVLYLIYIEGTMIFLDEKDMTLDAHYIMIKGGTLIAGLPNARYKNKLTITIHGNIDGKMLPGFGNKGIFMQEGSIDLHGQIREPAWTELAETAVKGTRIIKTKVSVDWKKGEKLILAPTARGQKEFEELTIESVNGNIVELTKELEFNHFAKQMTFGSRTFDIRAEVGLMTRNILIQGDPSTEEKGFGVHVLMRGREGKVRGRFSYIEVFRAGQQFQIGRYPLHYHMIGHVIDNYIRGCAIHRTFNRGTTVHGVHFLELSNNIWYDVRGHGIFIEDSVESRNIMKDNLIMHINPSAGLLKSDLHPAGIWITRPNNFIFRNHSVGNNSFGFWFDLPGHPSGPSGAGNSNVCPKFEKLGRFSDNVAHGNSIGVRVYPNYVPRTDMCGPGPDHKLRNPFSNNEPVVAELKDNISYMNGTGIFGKLIGAINYKNFILLSNGISISISKPSGAPDSVPRVEGALVVGESELNQLHGGSAGSLASLPQKDGLLLKDMDIHNFPNANNYLFNMCSGCGSETKRDYGVRRTTFQNFTWTNVKSKMIRYRDARMDKDVIKDNNGSFVKRFGDQFANWTGGWVFPYFKYLHVPECVKISVSENKANNDVLVCNDTVQVLRLVHSILDNQSRFNGQKLKILNLHHLTDKSYTFHDDMVVVKDDKNKVIRDETEFFSEHIFRNAWLSIHFRGWAIPIVTGYTYNVHWGQGVEFKKAKVENNIYWIESTRATFMRFNHTEPRELFDNRFVGLDEKDVWQNNLKITAGPNAPKDADEFGTYFHSKSDKLNVIQFSLNGRRRGHIEPEGVYCREFCPQSEGTDVTNNDYVDKVWSDPAAWPKNKVPVELEEVVIDKTIRMKLDVDTPLLESLKINGMLIFDETKESLKLRTKRIEITEIGEMIAGKWDADETKRITYKKKIHISLEGKKNDTYYVVSPEIAPVNKAILNKGKLVLVGQPPAVVWSRLKASAIAGAESIFIKDNTPGWKIGDQIIIGSSSTNMEHTDLRTITNILTGTGEIKLDKALSYFHYGAANPINYDTNVLGSLKTLDMRAEVGHLSRNIVIEGDKTDNWGMNILTPNYITNKSGTQIQGNLRVHGIEVRGGGQRDTSKAAFDFQYVRKSIGTHTIHKCAIHDGQGWALNLFATQGVDFTKNVIYNSRKFGIFLQSAKHINISNNLLIRVRERENYESPEFWDMIIGLYYNDTSTLQASDVKIKNNAISSVPWFAFMVPGYPCNINRGDIAKMNFFNNTGHSSKAGWFLWKLGDQRCVKMSHFIGYKNTDQGVVNRQDIFEARVSDMILADNGNALAINGGKAKNKSVYPVNRLTNSVIVGRALADCKECYKGESECNQNGIYTSLFNSAKYDFYFEKTRMPLHNSTSAGFMYGGKQLIEDVEFINFKKEKDCKERNFAIRMNNFYQDASVAVYLKRTKLTNVDDKSKFYFPNHKRHLNTPVHCGNHDCTANYNTPIYDLDGSIFGGKQMTFFGNNRDTDQDRTKGTNRNAGIDGECTFFETWNGFGCNNEYAQLLVISPGGARTPIITPLTLERRDYDVNIAEDFQFHNDVESLINLTAMVRKDVMTDLFYKSELKSGIKYQLFSSNDNDYTILKMNSTNPATMVVVNTKRNKSVDSIVLNKDEKLDLSIHSRECGANHYYPANRTIIFLVTGKSNCQVQIKNIDSIKLTTRFDIPVADFYKEGGVSKVQDNIAALLGIPVYRIRVVSVVEGSSVVNILILSEFMQGIVDPPAGAEDNPNPDNTEPAKPKSIQERINDLQKFVDKLKENVEVGNNILGFQVLSVESEINLDDTIEYDKPKDEEKPTTPGEKESRTTMYIGIGFGVGIISILGTIFIVGLCKGWFKPKKINDEFDDTTNFVGDQNRPRNKTSVIEYPASDQ